MNLSESLARPACRPLLRGARCLALATLVLGALPAAAQTAAAATPATSDAQASLVRAQRLADSPLRRILMASRLPARAGAAAGADAVSAGAPTALLTLAKPWSDSEGLRRAPPVQGGADAAATVDLAEPAWPELPVLPDHAPLAPAPEVPQLQTLVEPELDLRLRDQLASLDAVDAVLTLRSDGSVAAVAFVGTVDLRLQQAVQRAMVQWRYAPLRTAQEHRVRLSFPAPL